MVVILPVQFVVDMVGIIIKELKKHTYDNDINRYSNNHRITFFDNLYYVFAREKQDMTPNGFGEFGYDVTNPIPFENISDSIAYLDKLKTTDGQIIQYERTGSTKANNIERPIDIYEISVKGQTIVTLYISPYQEHNCMTVPKGFML
ncbi:MAG: hypothetical protein AB8G11_26385 [Saprospiraceae bacterium]